MSVARTDSLSASLNAVVSRDLERAFADAQRVDDRRARNEPLGCLAGLPMTVKDTLDMEGLPASSGLKSLLNRRASDADVVRRVRLQDGIIWGKTNTPVKAADWQSYNALYGTTNNPWDLERTPGGSSGGSAAALAAGLNALEIGSDIGGSLRVPASFCGVFAHKPTYGLVSQRGHVPPLTLDCLAGLDLAVIGPMARSARDIRLLLSVIAENPYPTHPSPLQLKGLKVALWTDEPAFTLDRDVRETIAVFAGRLAATGAVVEPVACPVDTETLMLTFKFLFFATVSADMPMSERILYESFRGPAKIARALGAKPVWVQAILGLTARHWEWLQTNEVRVRMQQTMKTFFANYDIILAPIAPVAAFAHDHGALLRRKLRCSDGRSISYMEMMNWPALATLCGLPATAMPIGLTEQNLPVGVQLIGPRHGDACTLDVAQAIEEQIGGFRAPPLS